MYKNICPLFAIIAPIIASPVRAGPPPPNVPQVSFSDDIGTDLLSKVVSIPAPSLNAAGIKFAFSQTLAPYRHNYSDAFTVQEDPYTAVTHDYVTFEGKSYQFYPVPTGVIGQWLFNPERQTQGAALSQTSSTTYQLITSDGTKVTYDSQIYSAEYSGSAVGGPDEPGYVGAAVQAIRPDGEVINYIYGPVNGGKRPLVAVTSSLGWMIKISSQYVLRQVAIGSTTYSAWKSEPTKVQIINTSVDYCDPVSSTCTSTALGAARREVQISTSNGTEFIYKNKSLTEVFRNKYNSGASLAGFSLPSGYGLTYSRPLWGEGGVGDGAVIRGPQSWNYSIGSVDTSSNDAATYKYSALSTNPLGKTRSVEIYSVQKVPLSATDELGRKEYFNYDQDRYLTRHVSKEPTYSGSQINGGYVDYFYDARRNVTSIKAYPKGGGTPLITSYTYEASCGSNNFRSCNKPNSYTDSMLGITEYVWSPSHGGLISETAPAGPNGMRRQIRFDYQQITPLIALSGGGTGSGSPVWRMVKRSECRSSLPSNPASCVGTSEEIITEFSYNSRNVTVASIVQKLGDGTVLDKKYFTYGYFGEVSSVSKSAGLSSSANVLNYDVDGKLVLEFSPDPDGAGALPRIVVKHVYDVDGREVERLDGYGNLTDGSDFVWNRKIRSSYDVLTGEVVKNEVVVP